MQHMAKMRERLRTLDLSSLLKKAERCKVAQNQIERLVFELKSSGISPINLKVQGITEKPRSTNWKELRSYFGAVNQKKLFQT